MKGRMRLNKTQILGAAGIVILALLIPVTAMAIPGSGAMTSMDSPFRS